jgi:hypothetical protein
MSDDNTQDGAEPSLASAGSHGKVTVSVHKDDSACAFPDSRPIRRQRFTLTDAEREAVEGAMWDYGQYADEMGLSVAEVVERQATLRGLLERTKCS